MNQAYTEVFTVCATDCDANKRMRPSALFVAMQEGGERHAVSMGLGYDDMMQRGLFFVLARIHVRFERAPRFGEKVVHTTWPGMSNRFFCPRFHTFALEDGTPLATAGALWVILDTKTRKIVSPLAAALPFPDTSDLPAAIELPTRIPHLGPSASTDVRRPVYSDYDVNGHINNTRYIGWLCDTLGNKLLNKYYLGDLVVGYEKEIRSDDPLSISLSRQDDCFTFAITSQCGERHFAAGGTLRMEDDA